MTTRAGPQETHGIRLGRRAVSGPGPRGRRARAAAGWCEGARWAVAEQAAPGFGGLLRQLRADAGLTQEELAEAARLSPRTVSDLERGISRTARKDTAVLLADALGLAGRVRGVFVAAAQGRVLAAEVLAARAQAPGAFAGNLPVPLSSFVGRAVELAELATAMARSPLVTVTGPGGVGKTRLALHAAAGQLPSFRDGAWLCELHPAVDEETMAQAVAAALRVRPRPGLSTAGSIVEFLRTKNALVVLDNCEHLPGAPAVLAAGILRSCRGVRVLATSRQALSVEGEQVFGLRPLPLPPPDAGVAAAAASDAVCLFVQRAAAARRDFALTPANVAAVGEVCRRLDGIPLAIELAAARVAALRPAEIAGLLDERFRLLTGGRADAAARQQTLQATVEWSYALLGQAERRVFDCLGVFPGSFDAAAAADIAAADGLQRWDILDSLTSLVGKSLVAEEEGPGQTSRYRLLETMRAYARQHLAAAGEPGRLQHRHAEHYAAFAEPAGPELLGRAQLQWQQRIRAERDNLQAAVTWALTSGGQARPLAFRIVAALAAFALTSPGTVRGWAEACAAQIGACPPELRAAGPRRSGMERALRRRPSAGAAAGRGRAARPGRRRSAQPRAAAMCALLDLYVDRAARTRGQHRPRRPPGGRGTGHRGPRRRLACPGGEGLDYRRRLRGGAAARDGGGRGSPEGPEPGPVGAGLLGGRGRDLARRPAGRAEAHRGQPGPDPRRSLRSHSRHCPASGLASSGPRPATCPERWPRCRKRWRSTTPTATGCCSASRSQLAAVVLARLGEAEPAAVLAGAFSAHFPPDISAVPKDERLGIGEAQSLARRALGEAAYSAALARGAAMDDDEVVGYAQGEYRRLASLRAKPSAPAPESPPWPGAADPPGMTVLPGKATCRSTAGAVRHHGHSSQHAGGDRPARRPGRPMSPWQRLVPPASTGAPKCSLRCQRCQLHAIAIGS